MPAVRRRILVFLAKYREDSPNLPPSLSAIREVVLEDNATLIEQLGVLTDLGLAEHSQDAGGINRWKPTAKGREEAALPAAPWEAEERPAPLA